MNSRFIYRTTNARRALADGTSSTARVEQALFHSTRSTNSGGRLAIFLYSFYLLAKGGGWLWWCSSLRASEKSLNCHSSRGAAGLFFTARIEGPPFHRGASASKKNGPAAPPSYLSEAARCASKKGNRLPATISSAPLSTPSPPSPCAAPHPWLVPAPSRRRGAAGETLRQRPSYAPHRF